jgi:hypothetical protein
MSGKTEDAIESERAIETGKVSFAILHLLISSRLVIDIIRSNQDIFRIDLHGDISVASLTHLEKVYLEYLASGAPRAKLVEE